MSRRTKTLIAAILIVFIWLPVYVIVMVGLAHHLPSEWYVAVIFYPVAGMAWIIPIGLTLPWMYREPSRR
jgi:hypothetical protein